MNMLAQHSDNLKCSMPGGAAGISNGPQPRGSITCFANGSTSVRAYTGHAVMPVANVDYCTVASAKRRPIDATLVEGNRTRQRCRCLAHFPNDHHETIRSRKYESDRPSLAVDCTIPTPVANHHKQLPGRKTRCRRSRYANTLQ